MLVDLINHFGKIDGFKDILERISDSEFKLRVDTLLFYLKAIEQVSLLSIVGVILLKSLPSRSDNVSRVPSWILLRLT